MALLLLSMVVAGVMPLLTTGNGAYQEGWRQQEMLLNVQAALDSIGRDFARAVSVQQASAGTLRFEVDTGTGRETVEYALGPSGDLTYRSGNSPPQPLAGPFARFLIDCFDAQGAPQSCTDPSLRQVELTVEAGDPRPDPVRGPVPNLRVSTRVARRIP